MISMPAYEKKDFSVGNRIDSTLLDYSKVVVGDKHIDESKNEISNLLVICFSIRHHSFPVVQTKLSTAEKVFFVVNDGECHWVLVVVDVSRKTIRCYDPSYTSTAANKDIIENIRFALFLVMTFSYIYIP